MRSSYVEVESGSSEDQQSGLPVCNYSQEKKRSSVIVDVPNTGKRRESRLSLVNWMALVTLAMSRAMQVEYRSSGR